MGKVEEFIVGSDGIYGLNHWNSYKGVHFDVMMDMKRDNEKWIGRKSSKFLNGSTRTI